MANLKYIGSDTKVSEKGKVHSKKDSRQTGCGAIYNDNPKDWVETSESVTCEKNGCK